MFAESEHRNNYNYKTLKTEKRLKRKRL